MRRNATTCDVCMCDHLVHRPDTYIHKENPNFSDDLSTRAFVADLPLKNKTENVKNHGTRHNATGLSLLRAYSRLCQLLPVIFFLPVVLCVRQISRPLRVRNNTRMRFCYASETEDNWSMIRGEDRTTGGRLFSRNLGVSPTKQEEEEE